MVRLSEEKKTVKVLVCICHHVGNLIDICLESVQKSFLEGIELRVVVVTSTDRVFDGVITIRDQGGPAHKRNVAVNLYGHDSDYIIFLDDDVEVSTTCIWNLVDSMERTPTCGMGFCKILNMERRNIFDDCGSWITNSGFLFARAQNNQKDSGQYNSPCTILASKSATCIVRRDVFYKAGGFDKDYYILGEETDLAWRIWLSGYQCWYFPQAKSWHAFGTSLKPKDQYYTPSRVYLNGPRNYISLLCTNLGTLRLICILPIHLSCWLIVCMMMAVTGRCSFSILILRAVWYNIRNAGRIYAKRTRVQRTRQVGDRELFRYIYTAPPFSYYFRRFIRYRTTGLHG